MAKKIPDKGLGRLRESIEKKVSGLEEFHRKIDQRRRGYRDHLFRKNNRKRLPYYDWESWREVYTQGFEVYQECSQLRAIIEKMVSYVVSDEISYLATPKSTFADDVEDNELRDVQRCIDLTTEMRWWHTMAEESILRLFRDGEYFRHIGIEDGRVFVRFIEPYNIKPDPNDPLPGTSILKSHYGIIHDPQDVLDVRFYTRRFREFGEDEDRYEDIPAQDVQHQKAFVDLADPRGLPLGFVTFCNLMAVKELNEAANSLATTQAAYALVRQYDATARVEILDSISRGEQAEWDEHNHGRPIPGGVHDAKGFTFEMLGANVDATSWVELINQELRFAGNVLDMPSYVASADSRDSNRSSLVVSGGPFDRRIRREQTRLGIDNVDVLWKSVGIKLGRGRAERLRGKIKISAQFQSADTQDKSDQINAGIRLFAAGLNSEFHTIANLVGDPQVILRQIAKEREEREAEDIDNSIALAPDQRNAILRQGGQLPGSEE